MGLLERLPKVQKCCFCIKNLKIACFMIIFWGLIHNMAIVSELWNPMCENLYSYRSPMQILLNMIRITFLVIEIAFFASIWVFLTGILMTIPSAVGIFVYILLLESLISIVYFMLLFIHLLYTHCSWYQTALFDTLISPFLLIYFAIVVNSYRQDNQPQSSEKPYSEKAEDVILLTWKGPLRHCYALRRRRTPRGAVAAIEACGSVLLSCRYLGANYITLDFLSNWNCQRKKMAGTKLIGSTSRLLLLSFPTFIMLSAAVVTEEPIKCYWCGPLAEQVHRSRRAPACGAPGDHVTACEPGLPYCAVVATSPPYVESRLCVKLYQDECYPLFCNSTKTWKMTCPCRGHLCNGPNTDREHEAFDILAKLVAKTRTTRIKKRTEINTVKFIPSGDEKTVIITNISALESDELNRVDTSINDDRVTHIMLGHEAIVNIQDLKEDNIMLTDITSTDDNTEEMNTEATEEIISDTTEQITAEHKEIIHEVKQVEKRTDEVAKPSEQLPTAEALQQNASPNAASEKTTTPAIETTLLTTTDDNSEITTEGALPTKNSAYRNVIDILVCLNVVITNSLKYTLN